MKNDDSETAKQALIERARKIMALEDRLEWSEKTRLEQEERLKCAEENLANVLSHESNILCTCGTCGEMFCRACEEKDDEIMDLKERLKDAEECKDEMKQLRTEECYSMLSKVLIEREQLKEELEYERNVRGKDAELEKLLQHCTVDELEKLRQERDDLREQVSTSVQLCQEQEKEVSTSERDDKEEETRQKVLITELEKQISEMQETEQRLRKQRDELDATAKRYRSERNAMRIGVVDALNKVQKKLEKHQGEDPNDGRILEEFWILTLNDVFASSLKNAHKGIEILQTYDNEGESATKVLIGLLQLHDSNLSTSELLKLLLSRNWPRVELATS